MNAGALLAAGLVVRGALSRQRPIEQTVYLAKWPIDHFTIEILIPELLARGDEAVEPLIGNVEERFSREVEFGTLAQVFCLGRIGGARAEQFLRETLRDRVRFEHPTHRSVRWEEFTCFAYAECAGERAVADLRGLYERSADPAKNGRWAILAALAKTGSREGALFALDHIQELFQVLDERPDSGGDGAATEIAQARARATAATLLAAEGPDQLRQIPVYRILRYRPFRSGREDDNLAAEFVWPESLTDSLPSTRELRDTWRESGIGIRERWDTLLKAAAAGDEGGALD